MPWPSLALCVEREEQADTASPGRSSLWAIDADSYTAIYNRLPTIAPSLPSQAASNAFGDEHVRRHKRALQHRMAHSNRWKIAVLPRQGWLSKPCLSLHLKQRHRSAAAASVRHRTSRSTQAQRRRLNHASMPHPCHHMSQSLRQEVYKGEEVWFKAPTLLFVPGVTPP